MRRLAFVLLAIALPLHAQLAPRPFAARALQMQVVDAETGRPLQGAIVVARWNWLDWYAGGFHSSARTVDAGEVLHMGEAVTDVQGRFVIDGYATVRAKGLEEEKAPSLTVFLPGYEPFQRNIGDDRSEVRLKRSTGPAADYAASIGLIQGDHTRGLHWLNEKTDPRSMPRMIHAIHREKLRLGEEGAQIRSAHRLPGLSGAGKVADARTGKGIRAEDKLAGEPYPAGAVLVAWTLRRLDGSPGTKRLSYSRALPVSESVSEIDISPWTLPGPDIAVPGWEAVKDAPPAVRVYGWGYRRSADLHWSIAGGNVVSLERVPASREPVLENVRALRREIDAELAGNRAEAIVNHRPLLALLAAECRALTPDLRTMCFPENSDVAAELRKRELYARFDRIPEDGPRRDIAGRMDYSQVRPERVVGGPAIPAIVAAPAVSTIQAERVKVSPTAGAAMAAASPVGPTPRKRIGGFSIEPAR